MTEYTFATLYPVDLPEALNYPQEVLDAQAEYETAWSNWAEAETAFLGAKDDILEAEALDKKLLEEAVKKGSGKHPGHKNRDQAQDALDYAFIVAQNAHRIVRSATSKLDDARKACAKEIILEAIRVAREGNDEFNASLLNIQKLANDAQDARRNSLKGLSVAADLLKSVDGMFTKHFDPSFPIQGEFKFPTNRAERLLSLCEDLELDLTPAPEVENAA